MKGSDKAQQEEGSKESWRVQEYKRERLSETTTLRD